MRPVFSVGGGWRTCLRIARREVWRNKSRSLLVSAMVGVPILLVAAVAILVPTTQPSATEWGLRALGAADALVTADGRAPVVQDVTGSVLGRKPIQDQDAEGSPWSAREIATHTGGRVVEIRSGATLVKTGRGAVAAEVRELDLRDPAVGGLLRLTDGRQPTDTSEVLVSEALAERGFRPGGTVRADGRSWRIAGVVRDPHDFDRVELIGPAGTILGADAKQEYLVDTGGRPIGWDQVKELNQLGLIVVSRAVLSDPPEASPGLSGDNWAYMVYGLAAGCVLLEIVLLAGPAFAVSARRQRRQLALLVAIGGKPKDVRRVVLAQGLVLGFGTSVAGVVLAFLGLLAARPLVESMVGAEIPAYEIPVWNLLVVGLAGTLAALAAAVVPALQAGRRDPVAGLSGRAEVRARSGVPVIGALLALAGVGMIVLAVPAAGGEVGVVLGTVALTGGLIALLPTLLALLGPLGTRLPLALRLAFRDTARHRGRSTAAIAAVMGSVIGVTALAIGSSSDFAEYRRDYLPRLPDGVLEVSIERFGAGAAVTEAQAGAVAQDVRTILPDHRPVVLDTIAAKDGTELYAEMLAPDCAEPCGWFQPEGAESAGMSTSLFVADARTIEPLTGRLTPDQRSALRSGGMLVPDADAIDAEGEVSFRSNRVDTGETGRTISLAAEPTPQLAIRGREAVMYTASGVISPETAERLGFTTVPHKIYAPPAGAAVSKDQEAEVQEIVLGMAPGSYVYVERGFDETYTPIFLILAAVGGLIVLVGTATSTALSLDDATPDLATLAAVGAAPRTRRAQAMAYAAVLGLTGAVLGAVAGAGPGLAVTWPLTAPSPGGHIIDVPWLLLGLVVVGVPVFTALCAAIFVRSRLPMIQRVE